MMHELIWLGVFGFGVAIGVLFGFCLGIGRRESERGRDHE